MFKQPNSIMNALVSVLFLTLLIVNSAQARDQTFDNVCKKCHTGGLRSWISGAPSIKKRSQWKEIFERDSSERMKEIVINGTEDHKRKGGCQNCSPQDIAGAIDYMLSVVK